MKLFWFLIIFLIVGLVIIVAVNKNTNTSDSKLSNSQIFQANNVESNSVINNAGQIFKPIETNTKCVKSAVGLLMSILVAVFFYASVYFYKIFSV